ncbi:MAG TPA: zinc-ribbon domain containing protein, partial [Ktedonobacteraceae bacterium]|nr:zinc-ribbon domain containing protein [Ktedonobacteraceae bacterium]
MALTDQTLVCRDCNAEFIFTVGEQEFYASHRLTNT